MFKRIRSVRILPQNCHQLRAVVRRVCYHFKSTDAASSVSIKEPMAANVNIFSSRPSIATALTLRRKTKVSPLLQPSDPVGLFPRLAELAMLDKLSNLMNNIAIELPNDQSQIIPLIPESPTLGIIGDQDTNILGYDPNPTDSSTVNCSSILKKRKQKMNKHKYKKRRKRDKFKRRNLENIKERKKKVKEKADERAKQAVV